MRGLIPRSALHRAKPRLLGPLESLGGLHWGQAGVPKHRAAARIGERALSVAYGFRLGGFSECGLRGTTWEHTGNAEPPRPNGTHPGVNATSTGDRGPLAQTQNRPFPMVQ